MQKESELSFLAVRTQDPQGQLITVWQLSDRSGLADSEWNPAQVQEIIKHFLTKNAKNFVKNIFYFDIFTKQEFI
jgi:hypothetical protein